MLFTAPAFIFLFLPFALLFCVIFGKNHKKLCLICVCAAFHIMLNLNYLQNLVWLPLLILYAYFSAQICFTNKHRLLGILMGAVPIVWLILMRQLAYFSDFGYVYPVGITLPAMCAAGYIWNAVYGDAPEENFWELWLYITFFPIMLVGPFIDYSSFKALTHAENLKISLERCCSGIKLFILGFVKRIAIGAVLVEGYGKIFAYSWEAPNLSIVLLLIVLIYFGVFFTLSGYYDMASGVSRMLGVDVPEVEAHPFRVATVNEYSKSLFGEARKWTYRYVVSPISEATGRRMSDAFKISVICICTVILIRTGVEALALCIPMTLFCVISSTLKLDKERKKGRTGLRLLFGVFTVMAIGAFWMFITMSVGSPSVFDYVTEISFNNAEYQTDMVLIAFSGKKYLFIILLGLITLIPRTRWIMAKKQRLKGRLLVAVDYLSLAVCLALFVVCAALFLPRFEIYDYMPFKYIVV